MHYTVPFLQNQIFFNLNPVHSTDHHTIFIYVHLLYMLNTRNMFQLKVIVYYILVELHALSIFVYINTSSYTRFTMGQDMLY